MTPKARNAAICDMFRNGNFTLQQVGDQFGVTREWVRLVLKKNGITERWKWAFHNHPNFQYARELYKTGEDLAMIADLLETPPSTVNKAWKEDEELQKQRREVTFWRMVNVAADHRKCWEWKGHTGPSGHGHTSFMGRMRGTHVIAFYLDRRRWTPLWVLHTCHNAKCCNPGHLYEGTPQDNVRDRDRAGRGSHHRGTAGKRLTHTQVAEIRDLIAKGVPQVHIAKLMDVGFMTINRIANGHAWKDGTSRAAKRRRFTDDQADDIRRRLAEGESLNSVARRYGCNVSTIQGIQSGRTYREKISL